MASIKPISQLSTISGKINKEDDVVYRTRNGKTHTYKLQNPYKGPLSETRQAAVKLFSEATRLCSQEMADPERLAYWKSEYEHYLRRINRRFFAPKDEKQYGTLRGYILAQLSAQLKAKRG